MNKLNNKIIVFNEFNNKLYKYWKLLEKESENYVFQSYEWSQYWYKTIGINKRKIYPTIVIIKEQNKPIALFPLGIRSLFGLKILEFIGGDQADYNNFLISPKYKNEIFLSQYWNSIKKILPKYDIFNIIKIPLLLNNQKNPMIKYFNLKHKSNSYAMELPKSVDLFYKNIPSKIRLDTKRQNKRLSRFGNIKIQIAKNDLDFDIFVNEMIKQKRNRYIKTGVRDKLSSENIKKYYRNSKSLINQTINVQISALLLNDEILATQWGLIYKNRYYWMMPTFLGYKWEKFSTGRILQDEMIKWSIENGIKIFDFTIGEEKYKKIYSNQITPIFKSIKFYNFQGFIYYLISTIILLIKNNNFLSKIIKNTMYYYKLLFR